MRLKQTFALGALAEHAEQVITTRLGSLGSPDLDFQVECAGSRETPILSVCPVESIEPGCLTFATSKSYLAIVEASEAAAVVLPHDLASSVKPFIRAQEPRLVFSVILELAVDAPSLIAAGPEGVRFKDRASVEIGEGVTIGDWTYIGRDVSLGRGATIYPQVFIDDCVTVGEGSVIYPGVTIFRNTTIGRNTTIHAGAIIGDDGFGYNQVPDLKRGRLHHMKNVHAGGVVIEDDVEIGSQVCVDRGLVGATIIGAGTKLDNQVHIAHNVRIGRDCIILAQVGIAGTSRVGDRVFVLGQAGVINGISIGDDAIIIGMAGVSTDVPAGRTAWAGRPAQKADDEWKQKALIRRELPRVREFFKLLKKHDSLADIKGNFFKSAGRAKSEDEQP